MLWEFYFWHKLPTVVICAGLNEWWLIFCSPIFLRMPIFGLTVTSPEVSALRIGSIKIQFSQGSNVHFYGHKQYIRHPFWSWPTFSTYDFVPFAHVHLSGLLEQNKLFFFQRKVHLVNAFASLVVPVYSFVVGDDLEPLNVGAGTWKFCTPSTGCYFALLLPNSWIFSL